MAKGRIVSNLTTWEVGQDLCACYDYLCEKLPEIRRSGFTEQQRALEAAIDSIAVCFNKNHEESHGFGLGTTELKNRMRKPAPAKEESEG